MCRCTHVPCLCVRPSADRRLGSRARLCVRCRQSTLYRFPHLPGAVGCSQQQGSGHLPPADALSAGIRLSQTQLHRAAPCTGEPTFAARIPPVEALLPAEGAFVAGRRCLTRFRWAAGSGRARSGGWQCEWVAVPQAVVVIRLCTSLTYLRCGWAASLTEQSKQDLKPTHLPPLAGDGHQGAQSPCRGAASRRGGSLPGPPCK